MENQSNGDSSTNKKLLEKPMMNGIAVPIAIVLIGALIIFGVTKMLGSSKGYKDLISELHSKTFGNRWVAAFELSKYLANDKIPREEVPWVVSELSTVYKNSVDPRTRNFIVLALGSLNSNASLEVLSLALNDQDEKVAFNAVVSIGNLEKLPNNFDWEKVKKLLKNNDPGITQVVIYTLAKHRVKDAEQIILGQLRSADRLTRYSAAIALVQYQSNDALGVLGEIAKLPYPEKAQDGLNAQQISQLKLSVIRAQEKSNWNELKKITEDLARNDANNKVSTKAREVLNILKN